jgi:spore maturation protein B
MMESFREIMDTSSQWTIPLVILLIIVWAAVKRVPMYESFVTGAKEGFDVAVMIIPYLVAILFVIKVFTASGMFDDMKLAGVWILTQMGMEQYAESLDLLPLALTRPLSGSGARGILADIFSTHGPDSFLGNTASLLQGSTETTFYIVSVYFSTVQIKKIRHTLPACLIADFSGIIAAVVMGYVLFS